MFVQVEACFFHNIHAAQLYVPLLFALFFSVLRYNYNNGSFPFSLVSQEQYIKTVCFKQLLLLPF